jgi:hypothetical protein
MIRRLKNFYIISIFVSFIFFWDLKQNIYFNFDTRILILLIFPFILKKILEDFERKNYLFFKILSAVIFFLIIHYFFVPDWKLNFLNFNLYLFFIGYLLSIVYYFKDFLLNNKKQIIFLFYISLFLSVITSFIIGLPPIENFYCGSVINFFFYGKSTWSFREFIFYENSHFGMVAIPVLFTSLFLIINKKVSILYKVLFVFFCSFCIIRASLTLLGGLILCSLLFLIVEKKRIGNHFFYFLIFTIILFSTILFSDNTCKAKLIPKYDNHSYIQNQKINENLSKILNSKEGSLSTYVFYHAANTAYHSLLYKPFGWGPQNYESAALYFNKKYPPKNNLLSSLNIKDGTNNFFKLIVEFGWFGVLLYLFLIYSFISKKISLENKLFLFPFIITQSIRGAGYFNGGFMLILLIIIFLQFNIQNKLEN